MTTWMRAALVGAILGAAGCGGTPSGNGIEDLAAGVDLAQAAHADMTVTPDLTTVPDLTALPDLTMTRDLTMPQDLTPPPDLAPPCSAVKLDGVKAVASAPGNAAYDFVSLFTVEAWVYPTGIGVTGGQVVVAHSASSATYAYALVLDSTQHPVGHSLQKNLIGQTVTAPAALTINAWHHLAFEFDGAKALLYVDGTLAASQTASGPPRAQPNTALTIGALDPPTDATFTPLVGYVSDVRVSTVSRYTNAFVPAAHFTSDANTVALYHFDEGAGTVAHDLSPIKNDATLKNTAVFAKPPVCH